MSEILRKKAHGAVLNGQLIVGAKERGVEFRVFSNLLIEDVAVKDSPQALQAFKFHNSDKPAALEVEGRRLNLVMRRCDVSNVAGDGIYATRVKGALIENCKVLTSSGKASDACQFAYERDSRNISSDVWIRGNFFGRESNSNSRKGALVCANTDRYLVEHNVLEGDNFGFSSIGNNAIVRSNVISGARLNGYSWGYGLGERYHFHNHQVYDNWISDCSRAFSISGFGDGKTVVDGIPGFQRRDIEIHDNVIVDCDVAFFADRPWSGYFRRNVIVRCKDQTVIKGRGASIASNGKIASQVTSGNYFNDGSYRCEEMPALKIDGAGKASVTPGRWTSEPDEIRLYWRDGGHDINGAHRPSFEGKEGMELSCVVLARKGDNWMLAIAESAWQDGYHFKPRSYVEGFIPWGKRYFEVG